MVDLGKHALTVLSAYGISLILLGGLIWLSLRRSRKMQQELARMEAARDG